MNTRKDNGYGEEILTLMRSFDLFAVDTLFKPERKVWGQGERKRYCNTTYIPKHADKRPRKLDYMCVEQVERKKNV